MSGQSAQIWPICPIHGPFASQGGPCPLCAGMDQNIRSIMLSLQRIENRLIRIEANL